MKQFTDIDHFYTDLQVRLHTEIDTIKAWKNKIVYSQQFDLALRIRDLEKHLRAALLTCDPTYLENMPNQ